jgi:hypothetical protein
MAYRAFFIKSDQFTQVADLLSSVLPQPVYLETVKLKSRKRAPLDWDIPDPEDLPDSLVVGQLNKEWIVAEYFSYNKLREWGHDFSVRLATRVVVVNALFDTNYYYFALYESGNRLRELVIQGRSDDDEEEWDKYFFQFLQRYLPRTEK